MEGVDEKDGVIRQKSSLEEMRDSLPWGAHFFDVSVRGRLCVTGK